MFERCPLKSNNKCGYAGYDKQNRLRCGFATNPNFVSELKVCPLAQKKARRKKEMILGWRSGSGVLAFIINALCEGLSSIYSHLQTSTPSYDALEDFNKECNHKGQVYHCKKCDSDIIDDFGS